MRRKIFWVSVSGFTLLSVLLVASTTRAQPAKGANKFLGNITTKGAVRSDFMTYWNQITAENEHKWKSVEKTRNNMDWSGGDAVANYAKEKGILWKFHTLIWGSQYPEWIKGLSKSEQLKEIEEWLDAIKARYPDIPMIDVVNEAMPSHAPPPFAEALGGSGSTGYDYIINSFKMARRRWPKAILMYNDYNSIEYDADVQYTYDLVKKMLEVNAPIDAIGCQGHDAFKCPTFKVKSNIDKLASLGLPIFITEYDIQLRDDNKQLEIMKEQFPIFWNHPKIVGITYWGYIVGKTWRGGTGLKHENGTERPALAWLKKYVKENPNPPNDFSDLLKLGGDITNRVKVSFQGQGTVKGDLTEDCYKKNTIFNKMHISQNGSLIDVSFSSNANSSALLSVYDLNGSVVHSINTKTDAGSMQNYKFTIDGISKGYYIVEIQSGNAHLKKGVVLTGK
ncbi:MAG: endo-1,4-beta-xylanase [Chitinispirillia bacterium]